MVCLRNVVVNGFGYSYDLYVNAVFPEPFVQFHYCVHRVVPSDVEESLYAVFGKVFGCFAVVAVVLAWVFKLEPAGAKHRGRSFHKQVYIVVGRKDFAEIDKFVPQNALDSVYRAVDGIDPGLLHSLGEYPREGRVYSRCGSA